MKNRDIVSAMLEVEMAVICVCVTSSYCMFFSEDVKELQNRRVVGLDSTLKSPIASFDIVVGTGQFINSPVVHIPDLYRKHWNTSRTLLPKKLFSK